MKNRDTPVVWILFILCSLITLPGIFSETYYELFSAEAREKNWWNYLLSVFQHGKSGIPVATLIHYALNMILLLIVGKWVEYLISSRHFTMLTFTAWGVFLLTETLSGIWINGFSGIIWACSPFLLYIDRHPVDGYLKNIRHLVRPLLWIMWGVVTIMMTFVPLIFNPAHSLLHTFVFGNLFHFMATLTGFAYLYFWQKKHNHGDIRVRKNIY